MLRAAYPLSIHGTGGQPWPSVPSGGVFTLLRQLRRRQGARSAMSMEKHEPRVMLATYYWIPTLPPRSSVRTRNRLEEFVFQVTATSSVALAWSGARKARSISPVDRNERDDHKVGRCPAIARAKCALASRAVQAGKEGVLTFVH